MSLQETLTWQTFNNLCMAKIKQDWPLANADLEIDGGTLRSLIQSLSENDQSSIEAFLASRDTVFSDGQQLREELNLAITNLCNLYLRNLIEQSR